MTVLTESDYALRLTHYAGTQRLVLQTTGPGPGQPWVTATHHTMGTALGAHEVVIKNVGALPWLVSRGIVIPQGISVRVMDGQVGALEYPICELNTELPAVCEALVALKIQGSAAVVVGDADSI